MFFSYTATEILHTDNKFIVCFGSVDGNNIFFFTVLYGVIQKIDKCLFQKLSFHFGDSIIRTGKSDFNVFIQGFVLAHLDCVCDDINDIALC